MNIESLLKFLLYHIGANIEVASYKMVVVASSWLDEGKDSLVWNCTINHEEKTIDLYCCEYIKEKEKNDK